MVVEIKTIPQKEGMLTLVNQAIEGQAKMSESSIAGIEESMEIEKPYPNPETFTSPTKDLVKLVVAHDKMLSTPVDPDFTFPQNTLPFMLVRTQTTLKEHIEKQKVAAVTELPIKLPTPTPLTATEKKGALLSIGYLTTSMGYLTKQSARNVTIASKVAELSKSLATVKAEVIADPPKTPLGLARYHRRR